MTLQEIRDERDFIRRSIEKLLANFHEKTGLVITDLEPEYAPQDMICGAPEHVVLTGVRLTVRGI